LDQPIACADAAEDRGDQGLGTAMVKEEDDPGVAGEVRRDRLQGAAQGGRLPRPWRANRRSEQRLQREQRCRLAPERPGRAVVRQAEPLLAEAWRRLAQDEPNARAGGLAREPLQ